MREFDIIGQKTHRTTVSSGQYCDVIAAPAKNFGWWVWFENQMSGRNHRSAGSGSGSDRSSAMSSGGGGGGGAGGGGSGESKARSQQFWKPNTIAPGSEIERDEKDESEGGTSGGGGGGVSVVWNSHSHLSMRQQRMLLPIYANRKQILYAVERYQTVIIVGQTGSGKTTQIPQYLHEAGWTTGQRMIACTQPRRVAASTIATRVSEEMGCASVGLEVGYSIRFDDCSDPARTKIKYLTDGMLLRETMSDPLLSRYSVLMIDEAHERSIQTDILLGLIKKIKRKRKDLRLIVSSATLDAHAFKSFFEDNTSPAPPPPPAPVSAAGTGTGSGGGAASAPVTPLPTDAKSAAAAVAAKLNAQFSGGKSTTAAASAPAPTPPAPTAAPSAGSGVSGDTAVILTVEGRQFPVDILYSKYPVRNYVQAAIETVKHIHSTEEEGDILVFLTGREEVDKAVSLLGDVDHAVTALPMYAGLSPEQQLRAFKPTADGARKVIVSTNVCEASVTIDNIAFVVDCGFAKIRSFDARTGMGALLVTPISQASANQRAGRAGRVKPGKCYRLYTESGFYELPTQTVPEIQRSNLSSIILQLKALGIDDVLHFDFMSPPPAELLINALELLYAIGALDANCKLTKPVGASLAEFPVEPQLAKMLLTSGQMGCSEEILSIAAMLSIQSVFITPKNYRKSADFEKMKFAVKEGDHLTLLNGKVLCCSQPLNPSCVLTQIVVCWWCCVALWFRVVFSSFLLNRKDANWCNDHYVNYRALKRAVDIRRQLRRYLVRFGIPLASTEDPKVIRRCIVTGYFANAAQLQPNGTYRTVRGGGSGSGDIELLIHPSSVMHQTAPNWVVFHDMVETTKRYMRDVIVIEPMWLPELAPHYYDYKAAQHKVPGAGGEAADEPAPVSQIAALTGAAGSGGSGGGGAAASATAVGTGGGAVSQPPLKKTRRLF